VLLLCQLPKIKTRLRPYVLGALYVLVLCHGQPTPS